MSYESNPVLDRLPDHLRQYIKPQNYEDYSPIDQAVWRYVMRKNVDYLSQVAHSSYVEGLEKTGISIDSIPNMYGMNRILKEIGWAAVAVDGFIPPSAFMEFQAYNVLVIASDIRQLENIQYTPAPDIIHEGAGHAPIIANPEYAEYLRRFGEIGSKAISSGKDYELYEAVRHLSIIKEAPETAPEEIKLAEERIEQVQNNMGEPSEMALIRNLHWWTVEYGLIGSLEEPKIYGAGLLSSIGESQWCLTDEVQKLPYSIEATRQGFDITKPQPQLYVTPDFAFLSQVLEDFADSMALRRGGLEGIQKLVDSKSLGTVELSTGIQVSGIFNQVLEKDGKPVYMTTLGPTALSYQQKELVGHGTRNHPDGFGSPIGKLKGINIAIEDMAPRDLKAYKIYEGEEVRLEFEGGVVVEGRIITGTRNLLGKIVLITFEECTVSCEGRQLFLPDWGLYHMAVGAELISAFNGPADLLSFNLISHELEPSHGETEKDPAQVQQEALYGQMRTLREQKGSLEEAQQLWNAWESTYKEDWLLGVEIFEFALKNQAFDWADELQKVLEERAAQMPAKNQLIGDGLELARLEVSTKVN
ncbi:aromatic amino acid hydroxylase [Aureicoccus marinus]|uniref:Phenylalanine 4-monooxygenase n=1 Tax=Aureicoccus marinus TaxID=754435 RepID=A0A2S7T9R5_9FLAO|nr:aromatic amino acid hydroxylase [Aureicoccus marinus]PQJ16683.1 phenylalanine 4-monooxygenase [Aureicoccus marinus]